MLLCCLIYSPVWGVVATSFGTNAAGAKKGLTKRSGNGPQTQTHRCTSRPPAGSPHSSRLSSKLVHPERVERGKQEYDSKIPIPDVDIHNIHTYACKQADSKKGAKQKQRKTDNKRIPRDRDPSERDRQTDREIIESEN